MKPISAKIIERSVDPLLSIETLRRQCELVAIDADSDGVESHPDDALLLGALDAAVDHAEKFTGRALRIQTFEFALDDFPRSVPMLFLRSGQFQPGIEVPYPPLIQVLSFTFSDDSDGELDAGTHYTVDDYGDKAVLRPIGSWPMLFDATANRVLCRYRAGYSTTAAPDTDAEPMPGAIRAALLLMVEHLWRNRGATAEKALSELPLGVEAMLRPWRVLTGMA